MKIRNGFVSNSSSSSFVIAIKNENKEGCCPTCKRPYTSYLADKIESVANKHWYRAVKYQ